MTVTPWRQVGELVDNLSIICTLSCLNSVREESLCVVIFSLNSHLNIGDWWSDQFCINYWGCLETGSLDVSTPGCFNCWQSVLCWRWPGGVLAQTENWIQWSGGEVESGGAGNGQRSPAPARLLLDWLGMSQISPISVFSQLFPVWPIHSHSIGDFFLLSQ